MCSMKQDLKGSSSSHLSQRSQMTHVSGVRPRPTFRILPGCKIPGILLLGPSRPATSVLALLRIHLRNQLRFLILQFLVNLGAFAWFVAVRCGRCCWIFFSKSLLRGLLLLRAGGAFIIILLLLLVGESVCDTSLVFGIVRDV